MTIDLHLPALRPTACAAVLFAAAVCLAGCQIGNIQLSGSAPSAAASGAPLSGTVHGGQYPIFNSTLQLYAAGAPAAPTGTNPVVGGLGQGATPLFATGSMTLASTNNYYPGGASGCVYATSNPLNCTALPMTTSGGSFSITGDYACPNSTSQVYLVATGGDPTGASSTSINNQYIALMAALGPCGNLLAGTTNIVMNEITTVGAVYALNQFMAAPTGAAASTYSSQGGATAGTAVNMGASSGPVGGYGTGAVQTQQIGLVNAFKMVNNISDFSQGTANPIAANTWATPYAAMTTTIADIIAACINTNPAVSATACTNLMTYAKVGSITPADTIQATWMMARYPTNVTIGTASTGLYGLITGIGAPFPNYLATVPAELTIEVGLAPLVTGGNSLNALGAYAISNPTTGAFDEYGHLWALNFNPQSATATVTAPNTKVFASEIDANGAYLAGPFNSYTAHGGYQTGTTPADPCATTYTHFLSWNNTGEAGGVAIDQNNVVWVTNPQEYTATTGGIAGGNCVSATAYSLMRITGSNSNGSGTAVTTGYYTQSGVGLLAVDANDNIWAAPASFLVAGNPIITLSNAGAFNTGAFNIDEGQGVVVDAAGSVWAGSSYECSGTNGGVVFQSPTSSVSSPTLTGGYYGANVTCPASTSASPTQTVNSTAELGQPYGLAVDKNNGIWVADYKNDAAGTAYTTITYLLPTSSSWINNGTQASPDVATPIPAAAANDVQTSQGNTYNYGLSGPVSVAVDGSNNVWVASGSSELTSEFSVTVGSGPSITSIQSVVAGASGLKLPTTNVNPFIPTGATWNGIDPSGNIWFLSSKAQVVSSTSQTNWVTVIVGAATPVVTPLAYQLKYSRFGQTPQ